VVFSGTKFPTSNLFFSKVCEIKISLSKWVSCNDEVIRTMALKMIGKYDKYWSVIHYIFGVAAMLDPRYKLKFV